MSSGKAPPPGPWRRTALRPLSGPALLRLRLPCTLLSLVAAWGLAQVLASYAEQCPAYQFVKGCAAGQTLR
jgi:hypothetical protein